jgi:CubicO group peptidase (beta-lactamase class C family)
MTAHVWGSVYATPVELTLDGRDVWRGQVLPLDDSEAIFLLISRDSSDALTAFVRNPERNLGRYLGPMRLQCEGGNLRFVRNQQNGDLSASYDRNQDILSVYLPTEGATFDLTRRKREDASGFYPWTTPVYSYHRPQVRNDGWETAALTDVGIDPKPVIDLVQRIIETPVSDVAAPYPQAFLVARHGKLALEEYFFGFHADRVHDVRSAGKTLTTTLVGIAMQRGAQLNLKTEVASFFPQYDHLLNDSPLKRAITIEHLLTMTSGLDADDDDNASPGTEDRLVNQKDRYRFTLDLPMAHAPGEKAVYSAAGINLLGGIVQQSTGTWLPDFIYQYFARPLDIHHYHVPLTASGDGYMAGGIIMRPRDFMKLGQMFLTQGRWRGRQIVSERWALDSTRAHSSIYATGDYGYGWWIRDVIVGQRTYRTFRAAGNGGQLVIVVPDLDLVVLFMGGNYNQGPVWYPWNDEFIPKVLIPAVSDVTWKKR